MLLEAKNISVYYGHVKALEDVSFNVGQGEIVAMIGPNGAGKSTALKAVFGMVEVRSGDILFDGQSIIGLRPDELRAKGDIPCSGEQEAVSLHDGRRKP